MKRIFSICLMITMLVVSTVPHVASTEEEPGFRSLSDPALLTHLEDEIYADLTDILEGTDYVIENVEAIYISQEYIEEVGYNTRANIYFGYTLEELDAQFEGTRYVFTLGEDNQMTVIPFEEYHEDVYGKVIRGAAIGAGVLLICVTIVASHGTATPAIKVLVSIGSCAVQKAGKEFIKSGVSNYIRTGNIEESFNAELTDADGAFVSGAIVGTFNQLVPF